MQVDPARILTEATALVRLAAKRDDLTGPERRAWVTDAMIDRLDDLLEWGPGPVGALAELADGPVLRAVRSLVEVAVQHAYEKHRAERAAAPADGAPSADAPKPVDEKPKRGKRKRDEGADEGDEGAAS